MTNLEWEWFFQALADRTRLRLLNLIGDDELCVGILVAALAISQPKVSRHLAYLRRVALVEARHKGNWVYYRVLEPTDRHAKGVLRTLRAWMAGDDDMRLDRDNLSSTSCSLSSATRPPLPTGVRATASRLARSAPRGTSDRKCGSVVRTGGATGDRVSEHPGSGVRWSATVRMEECGDG